MFHVQVQHTVTLMMPRKASLKATAGLGHPIEVAQKHYPIRVQAPLQAQRVLNKPCNIALQSDGVLRNHRGWKAR